MFILTLVFYLVAAVTAETEETKAGKSLSVLNVIRFPNTDCVGSNSLNGTCYTASECTSLSGTAAGACASSFGVCCVFSLSCGATTSQNGSYAMISSFSTSTDADPCTYTYCKNNDDVCKLRIDYESMVIAGPETATVADTTKTHLDGASIGSCNTDTLTVGVPGFTPPPIICGYNTGQHMWVPACPSCVTITLDIDTVTTSPTRSWNIKVTQYECGNLRAPEQNCLQYHTAASGRFASFNWDTSQTSNLKADLRNQFHLADQYYNICIRRSSGYCSICYSPEIVPTITGGAAAPTEGSSFGVSAASLPIGTVTSAAGTVCSGVTTAHATATSAVGLGDYLSIDNLQEGPTGTAANNFAFAATSTVATTLVPNMRVDKICGIVFNAIADNTGAFPATACTFKVPFRVGVHFDSEEAIAAPPASIVGNDMWSAVENAIAVTNTADEGEGVGYNGFYLAYWQNTC